MKTKTIRGGPFAKVSKLLKLVPENPNYTFYYVETDEQTYKGLTLTDAMLLWKEHSEVDTSIVRNVGRSG